MQREIKFRVWSKSRKMTRAFTINELLSYYSGEASDFYIDDDSIYLQYTGIKDRHDKEIYEGDIILCGSIKDEVKYINGSYVVGEYLLAEIIYFDGYMKVIGNVFEGVSK